MENIKKISHQPKKKKKFKFFEKYFPTAMPNALLNSKVWGNYAAM
jgi:hypothetical protein